MKNRLGFLTAIFAIGAFGFSACEPSGDSLTEPQNDALRTSDHAPGAIVVRNTGNGPLLWQFIDEGDGNAEGNLVNGPGTPPLRSGSAEFLLDNGAEAMSLQNFNPRFVGARLDAIDELEYCTYVESAPSTQAVALQFNFDDDVTDSDTRWMGRIVFEPANNTDQQPVQQDTWQCWDALNDGDAKWWATGSGATQVDEECPNAAPFCTLDDLLAEFPDAGINSKFGGILLKAGSGWSTFDGNADALTIVINGAQTTYDFEASSSGNQ